MAFDPILNAMRGLRYSEWLTRTPAAKHDAKRFYLAAIKNDYREMQAAVTDLEMLGILLMGGNKV